MSIGDESINLEPNKLNRPACPHSLVGESSPDPRNNRKKNWAYDAKTLQIIDGSPFALLAIFPHSLVGGRQVQQQ